MTDFSLFPRHQFFFNRTILALDYGRIATGLALYTPGVHPFPLAHSRLLMENLTNAMAELKTIINDECIDIIVLGLPRHSDGKASKMTEEVLQFKDQLQTLFALPIYLQDETYTTEEAERRMQNSPQYNYKVDPKKIDAVAAQIILEDFMTNRNELE